jgi:Domain of unknown function (DUF1963)
MSDVAQLRHDLGRDVRAACLAKLDKLRQDCHKGPLPTDETVSQFADMLAREAVPVANMKLALQQGAFALGQSRVAGTPDLPPSLEWPRYLGRALAFLAQIDLATLPDLVKWPTPNQGWLFIFLGNDSEWESEGDKGHPPVKVIYFGGSSSELEPCPTPAGVIVPRGLADALPYSLKFELSLSLPMGGAGYRSKAWERPEFPDIQELDLGHLLLDSDPWAFRDAKSQMFGHRRDDQNCDSRFQAAAIVAGFGPVMHFRNWSQEIHDRHLAQRIEKWQRTLSPERLAAAKAEVEAEKMLFEAFKRKQASIEAEIPFWEPLFSLGSLLQGSTGRSNGKWHFKWWDAQTLRVLVDMRMAPHGDFSRAAVLVTD